METSALLSYWIGFRQVSKLQDITGGFRENIESDLVSVRRLVPVSRRLPPMYRLLSSVFCLPSPDSCLPPFKSEICYLKCARCPRASDLQASHLCYCPLPTSESFIHHTAACAAK